MIARESGEFMETYELMFYIGLMSQNVLRNIMDMEEKCFHNKGQS
jgi:hypothetical protein